MFDESTSIVSILRSTQHGWWWWTSEQPFILQTYMKFYDTFLKPWGFVTYLNPVRIVSNPSLLAVYRPSHHDNPSTLPTVHQKYSIWSVWVMWCDLHTSSFLWKRCQWEKSYMEKCENDTLIDCRRNVDLSQGDIMCEFGERGYVDYFAEELWAIG